MYILGKKLTVRKFLDNSMGISTRGISYGTAIPTGYQIFSTEFFPGFCDEITRGFGCSGRLPTPDMAHDDGMMIHVGRTSEPGVGWTGLA